MLVMESLPQNVVFLDSVPSIATLQEGLSSSLFPWDIEFASSNRHRTKKMRMHFRGLEQAAAKIYINGFKNTEFFENCAKYVFLIFVKSTRVIILIGGN